MKMMNNLRYNPYKTNIMIFLEQFTLNIDNKFSVANKITLMSNFNMNYLNQSNKNKLESIITPYGLKLFYPNDETRVNFSAKTGCQSGSSSIKITAICNSFNEMITRD